MSSPGVLRLLVSLQESSEEITPLIDDAGRVSYPAAVECLGERDGSPFDVLESLTERGILYREFRDKAYVCPDCRAEGMSYTTICPACGSPHTIERELLEHVECSGAAPPEEFQTADGEYVCPACELSLRPEHTERLNQHVCRRCNERGAPAAGLRCRECVGIYDPTEAIEWVLYSYGFDRDGERWLDRQLTARRTTAEMLEDRGFSVDVATTVSENAVHIYAEDDLLGDCVVADVHEQATGDDVESLLSAADVVNGRAIIVTTAGLVTERASELIDTYDVGLLSYQRDGSLCRETETNAPDTRQSVVDRLTSGVRQFTQ